MNFREAEAYLLSLGNEVTAMKLGLDSIRKLLDALGNPQQNYLKVQVAGTNGKGSVCALLKSICLRAGIKAGVFTSPHLVSITERVNIGGVDIKEREFARLATGVRETAEGLVAGGEIESVPTFFEQITAIALLAFAEAKVELGILETGLGGRLDATTAAGAEIAAITRIDYDHQQFLGETLAEIAAEKAAILREDSIVVFSAQSREVEQVISGRCREIGVEPFRATAEIVTRNYDEDPSYPIRRTTFRTERENYHDIVLGLHGKHQEENAAVVITIVERLIALGYKISDEDVWIGLETARHPGRLEFIGNVLLDGAHNVGGAMALRAFLNEFVDKPITLVFGAMDDKDISTMAEILSPNADRIILTQADNSRAMPVEKLAEQIEWEIDREKIILTNSAKEALEKARAISTENDLILVTGSLYLVGEVKKILNN